MIEFDHVTKRYGRTLALDDFSLTLTEPGIYCLLGRNGAGKTTLLKSLAGFLPVTNGAVTVNGAAVSTLNMPASVHFVETAASQFNLRLLDLFSAAQVLNPQFDAVFAREAARRFKLDTHKRYRQLSFGMRAMVNTLLALSSGKQILLLDEPVLGFDPVMRKTFYDLLATSCADRDKTVIVSTHIIDEIEKTAQRLIVVHRGRLVWSSDMAEIDELAYNVTGPTASVIAATEGLKVLSDTKAGGFLSRNVLGERLPASDNYRISGLGLSDFFISLVEDNEEAN